jgi:hypothetical protein
MGLHLTTDYSRALEYLKDNFKYLCKHKGDIQVQNQIKEKNKGSIKNLLESTKNSIYTGIPVHKFEEEDTYKQLQLLVEHDVSLDKIDVDMIITNLKTYGMFNLLNELVVILEQKGASELAVKAKDNSYYKYLCVKELIETYLDSEVGGGFEAQYSNLLKAISEIIY